MSHTPSVTAALIIIGNEILSGRTLDKNTQHISQKLGEHGIRLTEVRIIPDVEATIVSTVHALQDQVDYVFTTGGLGPTHDDITVDCIAAAFDTVVEVNEDAYNRLLNHYGAAEFTQARQRMARIPKGAALIDNPVSVAPGFQLGNVYCMAGVPRIMQGMLDGILPNLKGGAIVLSRTVSFTCPESELAAPLRALQERYPALDIGSYPYFHSGATGVSVVLRGTDEKILEKAEKELKNTQKSP